MREEYAERDFIPVLTDDLCENSALLFCPRTVHD